MDNSHWAKNEQHSAKVKMPIDAFNHILLLFIALLEIVNFIEKLPIHIAIKHLLVIFVSFKCSLIMYSVI
jgi:hypothetical protein